ncbi:MAG: DUF4105 domain-containing protein [Chloroflexi bacterium]|nr:DUF4105 domain-containing protein [Chloroflexota bacterium]
MPARPVRPLIRRALALLGILLLVLGTLALVPRLRTPRHDRVWAADNARLAAVRRVGRQVTVANVRNARYRTAADYDVHWTERTVDLDSLVSVWAAVEPCREHPAIGHTLLSFGFADGQYLALSIEVRKEPGEDLPFGFSAVIPLTVNQNSRSA